MGLQARPSDLAGHYRSVSNPNGNPSAIRDSMEAHFPAHRFATATLPLATGSEALALVIIHAAEPAIAAGADLIDVREDATDQFLIFGVGEVRDRGSHLGHRSCGNELSSLGQPSLPPLTS